MGTSEPTPIESLHDPFDPFEYATTQTRSWTPQGDPFDECELAIAHAPIRDVWSGNADTDKYWSK